MLRKAKQALPPRPRGLSPLQATLYVIQTRSRLLNAWLLDVMPGLPPPPLTDEEKKAEAKNQFVDLWTLTLADHRRLWREAWAQYKGSFSPENAASSSSKDLTAALSAKGHEVKSTVDTHLATHHPELKAEIDTWSGQVSEKLVVMQGEAKKHAAEMKTQAQALDVERIPEHVADAVSSLKQRKVVDVKRELEEWVIDKLLVGRLTVMGFVEGYREGKDQEMARDTPLLKTLAEQATAKHKDEIDAKKAQFLKLVQEFDAKEKLKSDASK
ncbi:hypothetical protein SPRG_05599 [Saprolegnia parasitica CBS 223.65]|uniref:Uncharacterized protein n=1 Tax=Saprolegnia parasitica (strain CBS 223.65) TaxID=695850 RepID=A0A067CS83_SAPPC|nr:hypothetical protein SPRG_05599 [Saprolegnia parasitica CBS 223.65]KDO29647.1 hypothetical protein SPRG_05599 [Saprolegnia parasitica CBS 223.65]|eukprot:XP_012199706.1 hypothetical protein SPRG_05599 [Saprolegnia parasitica CBS 223.65]